MSMTWSGTATGKGTIWPDLTKDHQAWEQAKRELGASTDWGILTRRAQAIKTELQQQEPTAGEIFRFENPGVSDEYEPEIEMEQF